MKKIILTIMVLIMVLTPTIGECAESDNCACNICNFTAQMKKYDDIMSLVIDARTDFDSYKIYDSSELTFDMLEDRVDTNTVIVERCIGIVTDVENRKGIILNTFSGYLISYRNTPNIQKGNIVISYMVYNPNNNYTDDIMERYDFIVEKWFFRRINRWKNL